MGRPERMLGWLALGLWVAGAQPLTERPEAASVLLVREAVVAELGRDSLQLERVPPLAILRSRPVPLGDIEVVRPRQVPQISARGAWEIPPFSQIAAPGDGAVEAGPEQASAGGAFSAIDTRLPGEEIMVRPRPGPKKVHVILDDTHIPEPLSRVCYTSGPLGLCQFSLYGGGSSYFAEQAFVALRNALDSKEDLQGFGEASVLGIYDEARVLAREAEQGYFQEVPVEGKPRPEALDSGLLKARSAPAFSAVSTELSPRTAVDLSRLPSPTPAPERAPRRYWILLAYFPDRALTLELALDQRLGSPQQVVDLAGVIQKRLKEER